MRKKFIFLNLSIKNKYYSGIHHSFAFLVPILKRYRYDVRCLDILDKGASERYLNEISAFDPSIVGFTSTSHQVKYLIQYSKKLNKKYPDLLQIAGGAAPTLDPEKLLRMSSLNGVCIGEGEVPLDNLLRNIENNSNIIETKGFYWSIDGIIKKNPVPPFITDLSSLAFPDYSIFSESSANSMGHLYILMSRGCPYSCYYCCNSAKRKVYPSSKNYFRVPSVDYCIRFLEHMVSLYPKTNFILFEDDLLISDREWFERFAAQYRKKIGIPYRLCARVECLSTSIVRALKQSGCKYVLLGIESGSEYVRAKLLNKKFSNALLIEKCGMLKEAGIEILSLNMIGFPTETPEQMEETYEVNKKIQPEKGVCSFFYPYKGTELHRLCEEKNLLKNDEEMMEITNFKTRPSIKMDPHVEKACIHFQRLLIEYFDRKLSLWDLITQ